jgi:hypothetical protein
MSGKHAPIKILDNAKVGRRMTTWYRHRYCRQSYDPPSSCRWIQDDNGISGPTNDEPSLSKKTPLSVKNSGA